jgi:hypothetical protein
MIWQEPMPVSDADVETINAIRIMLKLAHVTTKPGLKKACYRDAGVHLQALRRNRSREIWAEIVQRFCPVSPRRAYELMAVASGAKPLDKLRSETAARRGKNYRKKSKA